MSTFRVTLEVANIDRSRWESVEVLADTGSSFSSIPREILERLGIEPAGSVDAVLADGTTVPSDYGHAFIRLEGMEAADLVMFGEPGEIPTLGAHTLESHLLAVDPVNQRLMRVPALRVRRLVI